eukprot:TRINITY_DN3791_c0_g1_i5.p1 TRINITY_DN3791_c0_g1~~TRINITY_DN3791_c0_g1_i5.p1  ORF type:complete len:269 (+),score=70.36 TRINITY_DN3791_c0_g1_i5:177-983(+)
MAARSSSTGLALAVAGTLAASPLFLASPGAELRGGVSLAAPSIALATQQAAPTTSSSSTAAMACLAMAVGGAAASSSRVRAKAAETDAAPAAEPAAPAAGKEVEPPAPPPFDPAGEVGVTAPLGYFDPLNFSKAGDEEGFRKLRIAEIKHGRVAMMAAVGAVIQHFAKLPGFAKVPSGLGAVTTMPGTAGFVVLVLASGALELLVWKDDDPKKAPGNYGNPLSLGIPIGWGSDMRNFEINNGRMAMFSAIGIIAAELATGKDAVEQLA